MVRFRLFTAALALVSVVGLAAIAEGQTESRHRPRPRPRPTPVPAPEPTPVPPAPRPPGGNDAGGQNNVRPGSIAPRSGLGIGRSSRSNIDLLSNPAANQPYPTPPIVITPIPPRHDHGHWHDNDRRRWWYHHRREHDRRYTAYPIYYPRETLLTVGTGLSIGGFGYPAATVGVMNLPAPAITYDAATGTYVYGYANPYGAPLVSGGPYAVPPVTTPTPEPRSTVPQAPPTALELAQEAMRLGMPEQATSVLRAHLTKNPDAADAQRVLAIALLEQNRFDDAVASMRQAYRADPNLANEPIDAAELGYSERSLRSLVTRTVTFANRVDSGSAWLTVAALMQAEGRAEQARTTLEKASKQGLEPEVLGAMKAALRT